MLLFSLYIYIYIYILRGFVFFFIYCGGINSVFKISDFRRSTRNFPKIFFFFCFQKFLKFLKNIVDFSAYFFLWLNISLYFLYCGGINLVLKYIVKQNMFSCVLHTANTLTCFECSFKNIYILEASKVCFRIDFLNTNYFLAFLDFTTCL